MALPFAFASETAPILTQLDANFAAVGALTIIPCTVAGTDDLVLTPAADTPAIPAYANYMQFSCVVGTDNTGVMTARIGSLGILNVYKDAATGPAVMGAGDCQSGNLLTLVYDSALNSGAGGFHGLTATVLAAYLPTTGGTMTGAITGTSISMVAGTISALSVASLRIAGAAAAQTKFLATTASVVFGAIAPTASNLVTVALGGASVSDLVGLSIPAIAGSIAGLTFDAYIAAAGAVALKATNVTAGTITPGGGTFKLAVTGITP